MKGCMHSFTVASGTFFGVINRSASYKQYTNSINRLNKIYSYAKRLSEGRI